MAPETSNNDEAKTKMDSRKRSYASNATIFAVFVIGGIVLVNLIATRVFGRLDLTQNGIYTLSAPSKELVRALPEPLTVKAYISKDLPPELVTVSRYMRDLMDEYSSASKGKLHFEVMRTGKLEVSQEYLGLCFEYNGQSEAIPQVTQAEGLEYMATSLIKRMSQKKRKVAFTTGEGESDTNQGFTFLKHFLEQEFEVTTVTPGTAPIPPDVDAVVVGGPHQPYDEKARRELDGFL